MDFSFLSQDNSGEAPERATGGPNSFRDPIWDDADRAASDRTGVPFELLRSIRVNGERSNADQVSPKGARGVNQFMPATRDLFLRKHGVDAYSADPVEQATAKALHLKESYERTGDWSRAVAGYNGGLRGEQNPDFTRETGDYTRRVMEGLGEVPQSDVDDWGQRFAFLSGMPWGRAPW